MIRTAKYLFSIALFLFLYLPSAHAEMSSYDITLSIDEGLTGLTVEAEVTLDTLASPRPNLLLNDAAKNLRILSNGQSVPFIKSKDKPNQFIDGTMLTLNGLPGKQEVKLGFSYQVPVAEIT